MEEQYKNTTNESQNSNHMPQVLETNFNSQEENKSNGLLKFVGKNFLALSILISGVLISTSVLYTSGNSTGSGAAQIGNNQNVKDTISDVSADDDAFLGRDDAPVVIIEFSDYQCPFCRSFWRDTLPQIKRDYIDTGKVKFVYRDLPLAFHPAAIPSAMAAECAEEQGKYWEMHDKIFIEQNKEGQGTITYGINDLKRWATEIGLNSGQFNQCLDSEKYKDEIEKDLRDGSASGATGTPSFFINGRLLVGAQPYSVFKSVIEEELNK